MLDQYTVRQLKKFGLQFEWNKEKQVWWFQKSNKAGKMKRTLPVHAENKDAAELAVIEYFQAIRRKSIARHGKSA